MLLSTYSKKVFEARTVQAVLLFLIFSVPILFTLPDYGITYDEPIYMEASRNVQEWLSLGLRNMLSKDSIEQHWKTDPLRNVHPSGVKWLYVIAQKVVFWEKDQYIQNRLLCIFAFTASLTLFLQWSFHPSFAKSVSVILLLLSLPRFFAHAHFAATDIPMTAFLMLFVMGAKKTMDNGSTWLTGTLLGVLASIKITSLLLALPVLILLVILHRKAWKKAIQSASMLCLTACLTFYAINPDWWYAPWQRGSEFLIQTLTRRTWTPFTVYFAGNFYSYRGPFHSLALMFILTTPILHLLLLTAGLVFFFVKTELRRNFKMILLFSCFVLPFVITALPLSPTNDGIRYLLPAYPFAACFMIQGLISLWRWATGIRFVSFWRIASRALFAAGCLFLLGLDLHEPARQPPFELSYYNQFAGGLPGALRKGYETTYWWEIFNDHAIQQVNNLARDRRVYFPSPPSDLFFRDMVLGGKIGFIPVFDADEADFMLVIGRPYVSFWEKRTLASLAKKGKIIKPVWEISLDSVPLLRLHRIHDST